MTLDTTNELHTQIQYRLIESLSVSERRHRELVESLREIVFKCDQSGCFTFLNRAWAETLGYSKAESLNRPLVSFLDPEDLERGQQLMAQLHNQQPAIGEELRFRHQAGTIVWLELSAHLNQENQLSGSLTNITDRKQAEAALQEANEALEVRVEQRTAELKTTLQELQRTQAQLVQTEKMSSLGQLVAGIAHEINNPVGFISGNLAHLHHYAHAMLRAIALHQRYNSGLPPSAQAELEALDLEFVMDDLPKMLLSMDIGSERIRQIVLSLRNFSRLDEAEFKAVNIHDGIDSTLMILQHRLKAQPNRPGIQMLKAYGDLPPVECYAGQLNQVFMNLLANAIDALESACLPRPSENGHPRPPDWLPTLTISTAVQAADSGFMVDSVVIRISDNGTGMPETVSRRIFEPFFTTKPIGQGTGMGLSISYQIVAEGHGGQLQCRSTPGQGTEFLIQIPLKQPNA
jgi:two-component system, NtrC family, sensor kinase